MPQRCLERGFVRAVICRNATSGQATALSPIGHLHPARQQPYHLSDTCAPARRQPHRSEIRRWRRQSVQMGRKICYVRAAAQCGSKEECAHILSGVAKAASRCCELANPAQVRQIASQTGVLLCRMRFVAGRGAVAKLLQAGIRRHRGLPAGALQRRAIGKMLLAGGTVAEVLMAEAPLQTGRGTATNHNAFSAQV